MSSLEDTLLFVHHSDGQSTPAPKPVSLPNRCLAPVIIKAVGSSDVAEDEIQREEETANVSTKG